MSHIGDNIFLAESNWSFGGSMAQNFDPHIQKSVPLYDIGHQLVIKLAESFLTDASVCYELGCSTGALSAKLWTHFQKNSIQLTGIDQEADMIKIAKSQYQELPIQFIESDITQFKFNACQLVVAYYTVQFIHPNNRLNLINRIYEALRPGSAFIMFEKTRTPYPAIQNIISSLYTQYKLHQGYTMDEIIAKNHALTGVLQPYTTQENLTLLNNAGFTEVETIFKYLCFEGYVAIKP